MKTFYVVGALLFASLSSAMPLLTFIIEEQNPGEYVIVAGSQSTESGFAVTKEHFLGKTIQQGFSYFGETAVNNSVDSVRRTMMSNEIIDPSFSYCDPMESTKCYEAHFMKTCAVGDKTWVSILIYPKNILLF